MSSPQTRPQLPGPLSSLKELEPFGRIKLIAFDLDGTLLKAPTETPGERIQKLRKSAQYLGARITLATGRTYAGARSVLKSFGELGQTPVILYNGSVVLQPGQKSLIAHRTINSIATSNVLEISLTCSADVFVYSVQNIEIVPESTSTSWECVEEVNHFGPSNIPPKEFNGMDVRPGIRPINGPATAILILPSERTQLDELRNRLAEIPEISVTSSGGKYIELRPVGSSKAAGMDDLARALNLKKDEVLAVGDNDNDVELLEWAGIGVAVKEASVNAYNACDYVSRFGAERGAIEVLDLVRRAKRISQSTQRI